MLLLKEHLPNALPCCTAHLYMRCQAYFRARQQARHMWNCLECEVTQRVCFNSRVCTSLLSADAGLKSCTLKLCACERHLLHVMFLSFPCTSYGMIAHGLKVTDFFCTQITWQSKSVGNWKNVKACNLIFFGVFEKELLFSQMERMTSSYRALE